MSDDNVIHFNPWGDFNDAPVQADPFGAEPDSQQIAIFLDLVFGYCDGWVPLRGFVDKGQGIDGRPHNVWVEADGAIVTEGTVTIRDASGRRTCQLSQVLFLPGTNQVRYRTLACR